MPEGTYFATTDVCHLGWPDGRELCLALPERAGVVAIPTQGFYDDRRGRAPAGAVGVLQAARRDRARAYADSPPPTSSR